MIRSARRLAIVSAFALAMAALPASSAYAMSSWVCTSGSRTYLGGVVGYHILGSGCTGAGSGAGSITIPWGTYGCAVINPTPQLGIVSGLNC
ncbi:hypothetical protein ACFFV7_46925 [Nonomuraea spiralis]|uniref:Uncharacterized protein n=1 Tax=Nonomuraea spiralis TaxID=46182 RepID=A0ABV5IW40_9ACTN|nr:hypothetical protein [Nonomuraea spiralis]GGS85054.1 hypothetical protein GCM10010176_030970 [Nonomuraea spiralis]